MKSILASLMLIVPGIVAAGASLHTEVVHYESGGTTMQGYLAYDPGVQGPRPGVLVVHEWWGHNDYARRRARMLAELGYTAFALDMYGDGKTAEHPEEAGKFAGAVRSNMDMARERFMAARRVLQRQPQTDPERIAAIGYCFGGGIVLQMAREGVDLDGVVSFHGSLATDDPAQPGDVEARVLVLHGAEDPFVKPEQIEAFKTEMRQAGVDFRFVAYEGAKHSFTNPAADRLGEKFGLPLAYDPAADRQSWQAMRRFLDDVFSP